MPPTSEQHRTRGSAAAAVRDLPHPAPHEMRLEAVLHALADPVRLHVVRTLARTDRGATCSQIEVPVSRSTGTHHFRVLREAGVIAQTYRGTAKVNSLRRADLERLFPGLLAAVLAAAEAQDARGPHTCRSGPPGG